MLEINITEIIVLQVRTLYQKNDIKSFNKGELILNKNSTELMNNKILKSKRNHPIFLF